MIMGLSEPMRCKWDVLLPYLLLPAGRYHPKGVGFSPFELLLTTLLEDLLVMSRRDGSKLRRNPHKM